LLAVGDSPALTGVRRRLAQEGWICGRAPDLGSALVMLHQVRPALVLIAATAGTRSARALRALRHDPFMAGVPLVLVGGAASELPQTAADAVLAEPNETSSVPAQLEALLAASMPR
jgi:hypothetical protein